jgi:hypothetical protein
MRREYGHEYLGRIKRFEQNGRQIEVYVDIYCQLGENFYDRTRDLGPYIPEPDGSLEWAEKYGPECGHGLPAVQCEVCRGIYDPA